MARWLVLPIILVFWPGHARAGDDSAFQKETLPRTVTLKADAIPVSDALTKLREQTGNVVVDRRKAHTDLKIKLALDNAPFWQALDAIAAAAGCSISTYQTDGQVALVDGVAPSVPTLHQGIFRVRVKGLLVAREFEAETSWCTLTLEIAWEPRFEPLYLDAGPLQVTYGVDAKSVRRQVKAAAQGKVAVTGRNALEVEFRLPAPHRSVGQIESLSGQFQLLGPGKMLSFAFPKLKPLKKSEGPVQQSQDGVQVSLAEVKTASKRWFVEVHIDNPKGNPPLESYQSWLGNNRIWLEKGDQVLTPRLGDWEERLVTDTRAEIVYSFVAPAGSPGDWTLHYRTPGRIGIVDVPFSFKNLDLP